MRAKKDSELRLGDFLRSLKSDGVNLSALAKKAGLPISTLQAWSVGQTPTDYQGLKRLSKVTGKSVHFLLYGEEDPQAPQVHEHQPTLDDLFSGKFEVELKVKKIVNSGK